MSKTPIFVSEISYAKGQDVFTRLSAETDFNFISLPEETEQLSARIAEEQVKGFIADVYPYHDDTLYQALTEGSVISRFGVGHDSIDKEKATAAGITVCNTPGVLNTSVKEQAVWMIGALARNIVSLDRSMRKQEWAPIRGVEVEGKTLAILGFGRIGQDICKAVHYGLGMKVTGYDQFDEKQFCQFAQVESFADFQQQVPVERITTDIEEAVKEADFVLMMMAVTPETIGLADQKLFGMMKDDAYFLNTARGALVNENDLYDALTERSIAGAALDVFIEEPYVAQDPSKDLRTLENLILTPHIASNTAETNAAMALTSAQNVMSVLSDGPEACPNVVN